MGQNYTQELMVKGPNIGSPPALDDLPDQLETPVLLKLGDNVSTDDILPTGARVLRYRSNIPKISEFLFEPLDVTYAARAAACRTWSGHAIVAGRNYGQGSSREHAALAPRYLGLRIVVAKSFARIHWQNLVNFGVLPLRFSNPADFDRIQRDDHLRLEDLGMQLDSGGTVEAQIIGRSASSTLHLLHDLSPRQLEVIHAGGLTNWAKSHAVH